MIHVEVTTNQQVNVNMIKKVFDTNLDMKDYLCSSKKDSYPVKAYPALRLYVKVSDDCNAKCSFCVNESTKDYGKLDLVKLEYVIRYLYDNHLLHGVNLSGGEPMTHPDTVNDIIQMIYRIDPRIEVQLSTNGLNFRKLLEFDNINNLESIHVSRHHYIDSVNESIFRSKSVASADDIMAVQEKLKDKKIININTLVMKGYIDSLKEIKAMLNHVGDMGIYKNGFVSLMKCNEFARDRFINFNDIFSNLDRDFHLAHHFYSKEYCECVDGVYISDSAKLVEFYARMVKDCDCSEKVMQLVYTSDNRVLSGFGGKQIY